MKLKYYPDRCVGCGICSLICSLTHDKIFSIEKARIKIKKNYPSLEDPIIKAYFCVNCQKCVPECPTEALTVDEKKIVKHDPGKCIGCGKCVEICPFNAIWLNKEKKKSFKCDLCNGDPICVKWCPHGALKFEK
jgi:carbon-monoxide dehydrogenase iron sulfur subunit